MCSFGIWEDPPRSPSFKYECFVISDCRDTSIWKTLTHMHITLQRCPRFWPLALSQGINPGVCSFGISEYPPRYPSSKHECSVISDSWDTSIWKTLMQRDGNGNANDDHRDNYKSLLVLCTGELIIKGVFKSYSSWFLQENIYCGWSFGLPQWGSLMQITTHVFLKKYKTYQYLLVKIKHLI